MDNPETKPVDPQQRTTMLFAQLVELLTQNAVMMLGGMADRQGRARPPDLNGAEMIIEMLSMLQKRTKGNLTKDEERMITGTLYQLQTAFAEVASKSGEFGKAHKAQAAAKEADGDDEDEGAPEDFAEEPLPPQAAAARAEAPAAKKPEGIQSAPTEPAESKVKFTKKYA